MSMQSWSEKVYRFIELNWRNLPYAEENIGELRLQLTTLGDGKFGISFVDSYQSLNGIVKLIAFFGELILRPSGHRHYEIPILGWLPVEFPLAPPQMYVYPSRDWMVRPDHRHVKPCGLVTVPLLNAWSANWLISGNEKPNLVALINEIGHIFSENPPFCPRPPMNLVQVQSLPNEVTSELKRQSHHIKNRMKDELIALISDFPKLTLSSYPTLEGQISLIYKRRKYNMGIKIEIPSGYPLEAPKVWVPSGRFEIKDGHPFVNDQGIVNIPLLRNWRENWCSLQGLVWNLYDLFSQDPPIRSKIIVPPHLRYQHTNEQEPIKERVILKPIDEIPRVKLELCAKFDDKSKPDPTERGRLAERLQQYALEEHEVIGDGNCQFRALSYNIHGSQEHHFYIRKRVVKQLKRERGFYEQYFHEQEDYKDYDEFLTKMDMIGTWGDHLTLQAAADKLGKTITVVSINSEDVYAFDVTPRTKMSSGVIHLSYWAKEHYNALIPK